MSSVAIKVTVAGTGNFSLNTLKIFLSTEKYEQKNFVFKAVLRTD